MSEKFEFASKPWLEEAFRLIREAAARNSDASFSICEVFTEVPKRLNPDGDGRVAWHAFIRNGQAEVGLGELSADSVDVKTIGEWNALVPAARREIDYSDPEDLASYQATTEKAVAEGRIQRLGDRTKLPSEFKEIHNALARRTA